VKPLAIWGGLWYNGRDSATGNFKGGIIVKRIFMAGCLALGAFLLFGCAQNFYNIPRETYEKKVRVLGVAPLMVDPASDIKHPEKDPLVNLVREANRKNEKELAARLKDTGVYFSVGLLDDDADQLFSRLFFRRERRDDAGVIYNKYFFKTEELKALMEKNTLDAVMLVTVSGLTRPEKVYSCNYLAYLESDYNYLIMTAQILDADGNVLWEYPNFRKRKLSFPTLLALQYPDFDEASANLTDLVSVKFKTIPGIQRAFTKTEDSSYLSNVKISTLYSSAFDEMVSLLGPEKNIFGITRKNERNNGAKPEELKKPEPAKQEAVRAAEPKPVEVKKAPPRPEPVKAEEVKKPEPMPVETIKEENLAPLGK
jgi:hypothetical protein